jgi:hypothetical protein
MDQVAPAAKTFRLRMIVSYFTTITSALFRNSSSTSTIFSIHGATLRHCVFVSCPYQSRRNNDNYCFNVSSIDI